MYSSRKTKILNIICVLLVLMTGVIRLTRDSYRLVSSNILIFFLFILAGLIWFVQIRRRVIRKEERKYLELTAVLLLFLIIIKTIKYVFLPSGSCLSRYIWYLYYFPQTFIVMSMLFAVLHTGLACGTQMNRRWKLLYIPAAAITGGILTNDIHQLAFSFPQGIEMWEENYVHGPLYFVSIAWLVLLFVIIIVIALCRCATTENRSNIWMPIIPLAIGIIYVVLFLVNRDGVFHRLFKTTEVISFIFPAFMEALIQAGLFPTNDGYGNMWKISGLHGGIIDNEGRFHFESESSISVSNDMIREAEAAPVMLQNGNLALRSHAIGGGYVYWLKDLTEINEVNNKLAELGKILEEDENHFFKKNQTKYFGTLSDRAERLIGKTVHLIDYAQQVKDIYQSNVANQQNQNMQFLTIMSAIFYPLTLITGWYGMNFRNMPELAHGYPAVILLSIVVVTILILIFKKKKLL